MPKKLIALCMAGFFLAGSIVLPLGDFSLLRDIPGMYHNYKKITTPDELSLTDFIGDYLLQGKEIFGHNKHDKSENPVNNTQFRHQANSLQVLIPDFYLSDIKTAGNKKTYNSCNKPFVIAGYANELLRPPLT
ncbi:hypothetical protein [uncultured Mucilaginibacter sp.]|uniref:hypothetical protein n=1 Tax=uncultured Mucilaginibacter sp. TaxID=797541 RepID=UPI0025F8E561|nr:hypothetical protein [uncultured Mucilaginibacter sp.]